MFSRLKRFHDFRIRDASHPDAPPPYENNNGKRAVEVSEPPPNADFEPVEKQRHFGILRYTVNNRFRKIMLIGAVNVILIVGVLVTVILLNRGNGSTSEDTVTTTTTITTRRLTSSTHPTTTTTRPLQPKTTVTPQPVVSCSPSTGTTFLFAYSNDFNPIIITNVLNRINEQGVISNHYSKFGSIRFDLRDEEDFKFDSDWSVIDSNIRSNLPTSSLSFSGTNAGSDILTMLDRFLSNSQAPVCGSRLFILAKRYPNETDYSQYVTKLRIHHSYLSLLVSTTRSGGFWPETLYYLASKTNGICGLCNDEDMRDAVSYIPTLGYPNLVYVANPLVYEQGSIELKTLLISSSNKYAVAMTLQDTGLMKVVRNISLSWSQSIATWNSQTTGNLMYNLQNFTSQLYNMTLDYDYSDGRSRKLQIRIYGSDASFVENWLPYDD